MIKCNDAIDLGQRNGQHLGDFHGYLPGDITIDFLDLMKDHDDIAFSVFPQLDKRQKIFRKNGFLIHLKHLAQNDL